MDEMTVYHHTSKEGLQGILNAGKIMQSDVSQGDAIGGNGTYVTTKGPKCSKDEIAKNNYDGYTSFWEKQRDDGKTEAIIEMKVPAKNVIPVPAAGKRDVYVIPGDLTVPADAKFHIRDPKDETKINTYQKK